jgi:hypothetical protein
MATSTGLRLGESRGTAETSSALRPVPCAKRAVFRRHPSRCFAREVIAVTTNSQGSASLRRLIASYAPARIAA